MDLSLVHQQVIAEIRMDLGIVASGAAISELGATFERLSDHFQALGICHLLRFADTTEFRENLIRSGHARAYHLQRSSEEDNVDDFHLALSRSEGFLDAVAAADLKLSAGIARLSIAEWKPTWEYEDDFCYFLFLQTLTLSIESGENADLEGILSRFQAALRGAPPTRLEICRALYARDDAGFDESLQTMLDERRARNEERRQLMESYEFASWPRSFVSVEGLALLQIASELGMETSDEYPLCHSIARFASDAEAALNIFTEIDKNLPDS